MLLRLTLICCFSGRAALQKRIMALLRQLDSQTAGNFQVLSNLVNFYAFWIQAKNWITIPSLMSNSNFVSFHSQAWESTYTKWQKLTFDLVNFGKDDSPSIDVQKYLRRRSHAKITTDNLQVYLYTFNFLATIRDQDRIYPFNINTISSRLLVVILKNIKGLLIDPIPNSVIYIIRIVRQTVRRITTEILGVRGSTAIYELCRYINEHRFQWLELTSCCW